MRNIFLVDLPNLYNQICLLEEIKDAKNYFIKWLKMDNLAYSTLGPEQELEGIWVFHSQNQIGPSGENRIDGKERNEFVKKLYRLEAVTTEEPGVTSTGKEKGVDTLLITHLFDTIEFWDCAYLLSGDGDYCPAVKALRRRGKKVIVVGVEEQIKEELIREAHSLINLKKLILADYSIFNFFTKCLDDFINTSAPYRIDTNLELSVNSLSVVCVIKQKELKSLENLDISFISSILQRFLPFNKPEPTIE